MLATAQLNLCKPFSTQNQDLREQLEVSNTTVPWLSTVPFAFNGARTFFQISQRKIKKLQEKVEASTSDLRTKLDAAVRSPWRWTVAVWPNSHLV